MANSTNVFFYREDVMMSKYVSLQQRNVSSVHFNFEIFVNACVAQAHLYAKQGSRDGVFDILSIAEAQIFPTASDHNKGPSSNSLKIDGVKGITTFRNTSVFQDIEAITPQVASPLQAELYGWVKSDRPRLPMPSETSFRLLLRSIARPGMFFLGKEEMEQLLKALEPLTSQLIYQTEWKEVIAAHKSEQYDLALFDTFV